MFIKTARLLVKTSNSLRTKKRYYKMG